MVGYLINLIKDRIGTDYSDFHYIVTLTKSVGLKWAIFGETHGIKSDFYADNLFRFGTGYLWNKDLQFDASLTVNTKDTPSVFNINFGASYRFDMHIDKEIDNENSAKDEAKRRGRKNRKKKVEDFNGDVGEQ